MSDTPETDAYFEPLIAKAGPLSRFVYTKDVEFARKLERERNEARAEVKELRDLVEAIDPITKVNVYEDVPYHNWFARRTEVLSKT